MKDRELHLNVDRTRGPGASGSINLNIGRLPFGSACSPGGSETGGSANGSYAALTSWNTTDLGVGAITYKRGFANGGSGVASGRREVLVLRIWGELTFAEIATTLGESINTVASRYRYGIEALRRIIKSNQYERV